MRFCHNADSNCAPLSVVITEGIPNREIQPIRNACATVSAVLSLTGMASGHLVNRSTHVSKYRQPCDEGRGPTVNDRNEHREWQR